MRGSSLPERHLLPWWEITTFPQMLLVRHGPPEFQLQNTPCSINNVASQPPGAESLSWAALLTPAPVESEQAGRSRLAL